MGAFGLPRFSLRGRVGRGNASSLLRSHDGEKSQRRGRTASSDGAHENVGLIGGAGPHLAGPESSLVTAASGIPDFRVANLVRDRLFSSWPRPSRPFSLSMRQRGNGGRKWARCGQAAGAKPGHAVWNWWMQGRSAAKLERHPAASVASSFLDIQSISAI